MGVPVRVLFLAAAVLVLTVACLLFKHETFLQQEKKSLQDDVAVVSKQEELAASELPPFTFDDLWDSKFSYSTYYPSWVSSSQYLFRDNTGIKIYDLDTKTETLLVSDSFYKSTNGSGWSISSDREFLLVRTSYFKQWRNSYNGSYAIYRISDETNVLLLPDDNVQYIKWSPMGHAVVWVLENDIYYSNEIETPNAERRITTNGKKNKILNGIPDWVYEEEMVFTNNNLFFSSDGQYLAYLVTNDTLVDTIEFSRYKNLQYPEMIEVAYPKAGTNSPQVSLHVYNTSNDNIVLNVDAPTQSVGLDHLFSRFYWYPDSKAFLVYWMNRISNLAVPQLCEQIEGIWSCSVVDKGVEESKTGWIGDGGVPFDPILLQGADRSYYTILSDSEGFWHVASVNRTTSEQTFLTSGSNVVLSLLGLDETNDWLYFRAAYPLPRNRHVFRIALNDAVPVGGSDWQCMTCSLDQDRCQWVTPSYSPKMKYVAINCGGPDVPMSTLQKVDENGEYGVPEVVVNNSHLIENKAMVKWPVKEYGSLASKEGITFLYQMYKPIDFDENKQYPLLIEVYGGPGFQKVQDRWTKSWAATHMVSQYDVIVASLDARGSGYRGDDIMHLLYKKIGQLEKKDTTEVAQHFAQKPWIDESRIAVWGWSYGGYTTTFTIAEGSGVFKCGFAVAPLATRALYDSIHTERYMTLPDDNPTGYEQCSILNSNLNNFKKASYSIIHGTADDNVHFQNAALISKALVEADVDFDNFFYADEAHSINSGPNANRHIYKQLTRKVSRCFGFTPVFEDQSAMSGLSSFLRHKAARKLLVGHEPTEMNDEIMTPIFDPRDGYSFE